MMGVNNDKKSVNISVSTADIAFRLKSKNVCLSAIILILSIILISSLVITTYLVIDNDKNTNNPSCPESQINMTNSNGEVYNLENFLVHIGEKINETLTFDELHYLVDDIIEGILTPTIPVEEELTNDSRRKLGGFTRSFGGSGGGPFTLYDNGKKIIRLCIRHGRLIDRVSASFKNGNTQRAGGNGGSEDCFTSSCITAANVRHGRLIDALQFSDNGTVLNYYGGNGGSLSTVNWGPECLTGILGRSGRLIDAIQFRYD